jgi:hypothetical protein
MAFITLTTTSHKALLIKENKSKFFLFSFGRSCMSALFVNWPILLTEYPYSECTGPAQIYKKVINVRT